MSFHQPTWATERARERERERLLKKHVLRGFDLHFVRQKMSLVIKKVGNSDENREEEEKEEKEEKDRRDVQSVSNVSSSNVSAVI
jgi:hypothetical protein